MNANNKQENSYVIAEYNVSCNVEINNDKIKINGKPYDPNIHTDFKVTYKRTNFLIIFILIIAMSAFILNLYAFLFTKGLEFIHLSLSIVNLLGSYLIYRELKIHQKDLK